MPPDETAPDDAEPTAERDAKVMALLEETLSRPVDEREEFLSRAAGHDPVLRAEVWQRALAEERMKGFLLEPLALAVLGPEPAFADGELLNDRFLIIRTVAQGGMGVVYEAWDQTLDKRVAIKSARIEFQRRLPPEVRSATEISHPNICRVFEIHTVRRGGIDLDFLTMEFVEGDTLAKRLKEGRLPPRESRLIAEQLCAGLAEAHGRGVIHGDLKSNNIILSTAMDGTTRVVITDFGLARQLRAGLPDVQGERWGTPGYMAPELLAGGSATVASDVYALGVMLYELSHGRRPEPGPHATPRRVRLALSTRQRWNQAVARCLAESPADRPGSAADVRRAMMPLMQRPAMPAAAATGAVAAALLTAMFVGTRDTQSAIPTVAVIPFESQSLPAGSEYLSEGIADSLIHTLAQFPNLRVIARSSSFQFANRSGTLDDIARSLGASLVVTGRIRMSGNRFIIAAELINPRTRTHLWGAEFDAGVVSLGGLEQELARRIAEQIGAKLNAPLTNLDDPNSARARAHQLLLRGQYQRRLYTPESRQRAVGYFEQALAVDPRYALANAELANTYRLLAGGGVLDAAEAMPAAEAAARRALAADADLAEAHAALADIYKDQWNWSAAEQEYQTAIRLKPSLADAHMGYGILLSVTGRYHAALPELQLVKKLDPVGLPGALHAAAVHYNARQFARALDELARARQLDPRAPSPLMWTGMVLGGSGRFGEAVAAYRAAIAAGDDTLATQCFYLFALARAGDSEEARRQLDQVLASRAFVPLTALATAYTGLGQYDKAIELLEQAYVKPDPILQYLKVESHFDDLKNRPEYIDLAARLRLP